MRYIWATRGYDWGFRFLETAGLPDPLPEYERFVAKAGADISAFWRGDDSTVALRFPDPEGREDFAGRAIPHEFVLFEAPPEVMDWEAGRQVSWGLVRDRYDRMWRGGPDAAEG